MKRVGLYRSGSTTSGNDSIKTGFVRFLQGRPTCVPYRMVISITFMPSLDHHALGEEGDLAVVGDLAPGGASTVVDFRLQDLEEFLSTFGVRLDQVLLLGFVLGEVEELHGW